MMINNKSALFAGLALLVSVPFAGPATAHDEAIDTTILLAQAAPEAAAPAPKAPSMDAKVILQSTTTGDGVPLVYPTGTPQVTARNVLFPPGSETPMHRHPTPLFAFMLEGELTITTEGQPPRHYKAGDAFMETAGWHVGRNETDKPARLLSVYMGATDQPLSLRPQ